MDFGSRIVRPPLDVHDVVTFHLTDLLQELFKQIGAVLQAVPIVRVQPDTTRPWAVISRQERQLILLLSFLLSLPHLPP